MITLIVEQKEGEPRTYQFEKGAIMIGRSSANDFSIDSEDVSRYHSRISEDKGVLLVQDLESTNGTYVNGKPVREAAIGEGDELQIGDCVLRVRFGDDSSQSIKVLEVGEHSPTPAKALPEIVLRNESISAPLSPVGNGGLGELEIHLKPVLDFFKDPEINELVVNGKFGISIKRGLTFEDYPFKFSEKKLELITLLLPSRFRQSGRLKNTLCFKHGVQLEALGSIDCECGPLFRLRRQRAREDCASEQLFSDDEKGRIFELVKQLMARKGRLLVLGGSKEARELALDRLLALVSEDQRVLLIEAEPSARPHSANVIAAFSLLSEMSFEELPYKLQELASSVSSEVVVIEGFSIAQAEQASAGLISWERPFIVLSSGKLPERIEQGRLGVALSDGVIAKCDMVIELELAESPRVKKLLLADSLANPANQVLTLLYSKESGWKSLPKGLGFLER